MIKPLFQNVVVAINGSETSIRAAEYGILLAKLYHCHLSAVYVVDTATLKQLTLNKFFVMDESAEYESSLSADGERYLTYVKQMGESKGVKVDTELRRGAVWSEVISYAEDKKAGLILLGGFNSASRPSAINHDVMSASCREIIQNARCSVLIVKESMIDQLFKIA